jgi:hypothetical protein
VDSSLQKGLQRRGKTPPPHARHIQQRGAKLDVLLDLSSCTSLPEIPQRLAVVSRIQIYGGRKRFGVCAPITTDRGPVAR